MARVPPPIHSFVIAPSPAKRYHILMAEDQALHQQRPEWAQRMRREREARGWSQGDAAHAMQTFAEVKLDHETLKGYWKRWEAGRKKPDEFYRPLIAATFGTVVESLFPTPRKPVPATPRDLLSQQSGMDTHELVQRIKASSVDNHTIDALSLTVEQLCCEYVSRPPEELMSETRTWLHHVQGLLDERLSFAQHRDILDAAGWLTLLVGCLEYDTGQARRAEGTRSDALAIGREAGNEPVNGWAHEMRAWFALTDGRYSDVIDAAQAGQYDAPSRSVSVQLMAQEAKAWARMGQSRNVMRALEKGRVLLDSLPFPSRPDNHFVVDPDKFDFYAMDCYRLIGEDTLAQTNAREIVRKTTGPDGENLSPMRRAEADLTLAVIAARQGDLDSARTYAESALAIPRRSMPSLRMVGSELVQVLDTRYPTSDLASSFRQALAEGTHAS